MADYVSKVDVIYPKGNKLPDKVEYQNDDSISDENENSEDEEMVEDSNIASDLIHIAKNGTKYKSQKSYAMLDTIKPRTQKIITENNSCFLCRGVMNKKTCLVLLKHTELITIP